MPTLRTRAELEAELAQIDATIRELLEERAALAQTAESLRELKARLVGALTRFEREES